MIQLSKEQLDNLFLKIEEKTILVVGDLMLDHYIWGHVSRISPEAPVPVVDMKSESYRFGGAANVTLNVQKMGANAIPVGVVGEDSAGIQLKELFKEHKLPIEGIITDDVRSTTLKMRIIAHNQHVVRADRESRHEISGQVQNRILNYCQTIINQVDGFIFQDYDKGLFTTKFIGDLISLANKHQKKIFVDPKYNHFYDYQNVTVFKPNKKEVADCIGMALENPKDIEKVGHELLQKISCDVLLITCGEEGMVLFENKKPPIWVSTRAIKVHDVSGAGDTVIAVMAVAMCSGFNPQEAATLANYSAGIVCGEVGIVPINRDHLYQTILNARNKPIS